MNLNTGPNRDGRTLVQTRAFRRYGLRVQGYLTHKKTPLPRTQQEA